MKPLNISRLFPVIALLLMVAGCEDSQPQGADEAVTTPSAQAQTEDERLREGVDRLTREAQATEPPPPAIELPEPTDWSITPLRALPPGDDGFTVGYGHGSGATVTFYQYTRGLKSIPDSLDSDDLKLQLRGAQIGIEGAVEFGLYESATETDSGVASLGNSQQQALWSQYRLTTEGGDAISDIYVWPGDDVFFKIRVTRTPDAGEAELAAVEELLTQFGSAPKANTADQPAAD